jgi:hypothetical protein
MGPLEIKGIILGLTVVAGMACIWLGYRLYDRGVLEKGRISGSGAGVKISVSDYGPGVAFALFGAALILFAATRTMTQSTTTKTEQIPVAPDATKPSSAMVRDPVSAPVTAAIAAHPPSATQPTPTAKMISEAQAAASGAAADAIAAGRAQTPAATAHETPTVTVTTVDTESEGGAPGGEGAEGGGEGDGPHSP